MPSTLTMHSGYSQFTVSCHALALAPDPYHNILAMSVSGADTAIKAIRAILHEKKMQCSFKASGCMPACGEYATLARSADKYSTWTARLGLHSVHMVAIAQDPTLLRSVSDESLWQELRGERFTTPMLRAWVPGLRADLKDEERLVNANCFGCNVGLLRVTQEELDEMVSSGVRRGRFALTNELESVA